MMSDIPKIPTEISFFRRHKILSIYVVLLILSWIVQILFPRSPSTSVEITNAGGQNIAVRKLGFQNNTKYPVLMLHGSPGNHQQMLPFAEEVSKKRPVILIDFPGTGASIPLKITPTFEENARVIREYLKQNEYQKIHLLGFSLGGGTALFLSQDTTVQSLSLFSSIGLQSHELAGDYLINHSIHALQLGIAGLVKWFFPHFGADFAHEFYGSALHFFHSDQRTLESIIQTLETPTFILHGNDDVLVSISAAKEHHRLLPNSKAHFFEGNHFYLFDGDQKQWATLAHSFWNEVETDTFLAEPNSSTAFPYQPEGFTIFIIAFLIAASTLISEDLACFSAGLLAANGTISFSIAVIASFLGILIGDMLLYVAGKYFGRRIVKKAPFKWMISPQKLQQSEQWFEKEGFKVIFISRFTPGTRFVTYVSSGILNAPFRKFFYYFVLASLAWTPVLVGASFLFGNVVLEYFGAFASHALWILVGGYLLFKILNELLLPLFSYRGRRLLYSKWVRIRWWEFWPAWFFNIPTTLYWIWLGVKYRSLTVMCAANPGIALGGVVDESKHQILESFTDKSHIACYTFINKNSDADSKKLATKEFLEKNNLTFPIVAKPYRGQRGSGVSIVKSEEELHVLFSDQKEHLILQEYISGIEFGVFYVRLPDQEKGFIYSITDKQFTAVWGDGERTIEHLILDDDRAVCNAKSFLDKFSDRLHEIPKSGEKIVLAELGTHSRGALFLNGMHHKTDKLTAKFDEISAAFSGFYFGRYDIRVPSIHDFEAGKNINVLELNGVTSEPTHIYHPRTSLFLAYKTIFEQWNLSYKIGKMNLDSGFPKTSHVTLFKTLFDYLKR